MLKNSGAGYLYFFVETDFSFRFFNFKNLWLLENSKATALYIYILVVGRYRR